MSLELINRSILIGDKHAIPSQTAPHSESESTSLIPNNGSQVQTFKISTFSKVKVVCALAMTTIASACCVASSSSAWEKYKSCPESAIINAVSAPPTDIDDMWLPDDKSFKMINLCNCVKVIEDYAPTILVTGGAAVLFGLVGLGYSSYLIIKSRS